MTLKQTIAVALALVSAAGLAACGEAEPKDRGAAAVAVCRSHDGVIAFDDEVVICRDQTSHKIE